MTSSGVRVSFVMEQHLGHRTYYLNLRRFLEGADGVESTWAPVAYARTSAPWERMRGIPESIRGALRGRSEVLRALSETVADVLFFNTQVPAVLGGRRARRWPCLIATDLTPVQYDRMGDRYDHRPDRPGVVRWLKRRWTAATLHGAFRLLPWSTWAARSLVEDYGVDPNRVTVVPPGVDLDRWQPGSHRPPGRPRVLFVGGDFDRKGGRTLLEAFKGLAPGAAELRVVTKTELAGGPSVTVFRDLEPNSPELVRLYQESDVFVLPTEAEAFGIAAVEAAAAGLPIVSSAVGGLGDIVAEGVSGLLVAPGNPAALRSALEALLLDPGRCHEMGVAARRRAEDHFDGRRNAAIVADLLRDAGGRRR